MKSLPLLLLLPAWWLTIAAAPPPAASPPRTAATPTPAPTPTPSSGVLSLTPVEGQAGATVTITGSQFFPNEKIVVYLDDNQHPLLSTPADALGGFKGDASIPDVAPADHQACVAESPAPRCATLRILAKSTAPPSPQPTPTPTATPIAAASAGRISLPTPPPVMSPLAILLEPPFVFFPALLLLAAIGGSIFWIVQGRRRRPVPPVLGAARVMHRSFQWDQEPPVPPPAEVEHSPPSAAAVPEPPAPSPPRPRPPVADERSDLPEPSD